MSKKAIYKRTDEKGRNLNKGESQKKDGRYVYTYTENGKRKSIYSWKLNKKDPLPEGKRECISLREQIEEIKKRLSLNLSSNGQKTTVLELVQKYTSMRTGVKHSTKAGYQTVINFLQKDNFGAKEIGSVRLSDAKQWLINLQQIEGKSYTSIHTIRGILRPAFQMACDDDILLKNPFDFQLKSILVNDSKKRTALTPKQEEKFLNFIKSDKHFSKYYDAIYILFNTGLRISEFCGLTLKDIDLKENRLFITHQLQRTSNMEYIIESTKTDAGTRELPITPEITECFRRIIANRKKVKIEPMIGGYTGFLFLDKNDMPMIALHWQKYFQRICEKYNSIYKEELPKITPHICRHTYCTKMALKGTSPKALQYLMGHSEASVTMDVYTHINFEDAKKELCRVMNLKAV